MTTVRLIVMVIVNIGLNLGISWLLYRWQITRRQTAYRDLCRDSRFVCQQARKLERLS